MDEKLRSSEILEPITLLGKQFEIGQFRVDTDTHQLLSKNKQVKLEPRAMAVLVLLAASQGEVIRREDLERAVWKNTVVGYDALTNAIAKLRKAFDDDPLHPKVIQTIPKVGYRLIANVTPCSADNKPVSVTPELHQRRTRLHQSFNKSYVVGIGITVVCLALAIWLQPWFFNTPTQQAYPTLPNKPSLVVLPFKSESQASTNHLLLTGISEGITNQLSLFSGLFVISSYSANTYAKANKTPKVIGKELGVAYVLTGTMQQSGDNIRLAMQLIDAENEKTVWSEVYIDALTEVFSLEDKIIRVVTTTLGEKIWDTAAQKLVRKPTDNFAAFDFYLKAHNQLKQLDEKLNQASREGFLKAIELDPNFGGAYIGLAWTFYIEYRAQWRSTGIESLEIATKYLQDAYDILGESYGIFRLLSRISALRGEFDKAIALSKKALELNPNSGDLMASHALNLIYSGDSPNALGWIEEAIRRNPHHPHWYTSVRAINDFLLGDYKAVISHLDKAINLNVWDRRYLAASHALLGNQKAAEQYVKELITADPEYSLTNFKSKVEFQLEKDRDHVLKGLRKAGFPE